MKCECKEKTAYGWDRCILSGKPCQEEPDKNDEDKCTIEVQAAADDYGLFDTRAEARGLR